MAKEEGSIIQQKEKPKQRALVIDPKAILSPLSEYVYLKMKDSQKQVHEFYQKYKSLDPEQCKHHLEQKQWYRMLYSEKDMSNLISIFGIFLKFSNALIVPQYIVDVIKSIGQDETGIERHYPGDPSVKLWTLEEKKTHQDELLGLKLQLEKEIEGEKELLKELKYLEAHLQKCEQQLILSRQKKRFREFEESKSKISKLLRSPDKNPPIREAQEFIEKLNRLKNDCKNLELQADQLLEYPAITQFDDGLSSTNFKSFDTSSAHRHTPFPTSSSPYRDKLDPIVNQGEKPSENYYMNPLKPIDYAIKVSNIDVDKHHEVDWVDTNQVSTEAPFNLDRLLRDNLLENEEDLDFLQECLQNLS